MSAHPRRFIRREARSAPCAGLLPKDLRRLEALAVPG
jgi:hypothetical protein